MFKKLAIIFVAVFCVLLAVPTMSPKLAPYFPSWIGPVSLGLDLKGGAQLLLEVDTNTMFVEKTERGGQCNHGRPVYKFIPITEIDTWFERL